MTAESTSKRITQFGFDLLGAEYALDARAHNVEKLTATQKSVMWVRDKNNSLMTSSPLRVADYLFVLKNQEYSFLMRDGGIVQVAYIFDRLQVIRHRLAYYPCPFDITSRDLLAYDGGLVDFIQDVFLSDLESNLLLRSPIRFDYSPGDAKDFHPASHLTLNDPSCRIPVRAPLYFDTFMKFILENFYNDVWLDRAINRRLIYRQENDCLSAHDQGRAFLNWNYP
jgi:hypothetical protein